MGLPSDFGYKIRHRSLLFLVIEIKKQSVKALF